MTNKFVSLPLRAIAPTGTLLALLIGGNAPAIADCAFTAGTTLPMRLSLPASMVLQRDTPPGTVIWTSGQSTPTGTNDIRCSNGYTESTQYLTAQTLVTGYTDVYRTKMPGIGFRVKNEGTQRYWNPVPASETYTTSEVWGYGYKTGKYIFFKMELIYVGGDVSGKLTFASPLASMTTGSITAGQLYVDGSSTLTKIACSLDSTSINVPLGDVAATQFSGVASTAGGKSFDLGLTCDKDARINLSLAGTQNTDTSKNSVLALTGTGQAGTATGVGVQLLYGGLPLQINNNILLKTSAGGQETLPFTARYYQTLASIGAGLANSSATLNITYQ
ncbi:Type-1A pilin [Serratia quinivorans]|jgi:type 1 fimbria pilin|uniref:fimbrial protein n=1 Tax=Serratia quinivorans TaxID=137545 RepID=UPI0021795B3C|nr:fimbrial protein [Serratia quinivorans]CAI1533257.1 Type-1A pilin [Serratia quinivorans]CAI1633181.1 Type-1A pilin [Serratia quinivorans]CAI2026752.1 Type-1A pilin [Serratia quinivorans]CAI2160432.1 Type-1A pilin [Serratia quinivorans]CAI2394601.1 Type-1A pilin [Serratia quinivorans]